MEEDIRIVHAVIEDIDAILDIEIPCFKEDSFSRHQFKYLMTQAKGVFYVLRSTNKLLAYISITSNARTRNLRIYSIAVHPDTRGKGYAQKLLDKTIEYAKENNYKAIHLEVKITNTPAIRLYEKNGFTQNQLKPNYYLDGSHAYGMVKRF